MERPVGAATGAGAARRVVAVRPKRPADETAVMSTVAPIVAPTSATVVDARRPQTADGQSAVGEAEPCHVRGCAGHGQPVHADVRAVPHQRDPGSGQPHGADPEPGHLLGADHESVTFDRGHHRANAGTALSGGKRDLAPGIVDRRERPAHVGADLDEHDALAAGRLDAIAQEASLTRAGNRGGDDPGRQRLGTPTLRTGTEPGSCSIRHTPGSGRPIST